MSNETAKRLGLISLGCVPIRGYFRESGRKSSGNSNVNVYLGEQRIQVRPISANFGGDSEKEFTSCAPATSRREPDLFSNRCT
jgi:hypothetical protein